MTRRASIRTILLLVFGVLSLLVAAQAGRAVLTQWQHLQRTASLKEASRLSDTLFTATERLSIERDIAATLLRATEGQTIARLRLRLAEVRPQTDDAMQASLQMLGNYGFAELTPLQERIATRLDDIAALRGEIDRALAQPLTARDPLLAKRWSEEASALIEKTQELWIGFIRHFTDIHPVVTQHLRFKHFLRLITEYTGRERALIGRLIVRDISPTPEESAQLQYGQGVIELSWSMSYLLADQGGLYPAIASYYKEAQSHYQNLHAMVRDPFYLPAVEAKGNYPISAELWLELSTQAAESLDALRDAALVETQRYIETLEEEAWRAIALQGGILLFALAFCAYSFQLIVRRVLRPIERMIEALLAAMRGEQPASPPPFSQGDEIGKLAQVLHAFQQNAEELKHYAQALERSNKELDDFAYIASHDLKEPLRGIHNHARFLLEDNEGKLDEESVRKLNRLVYLSQRMERLVNDLLYFSRLGRQALAIQPTDLNAVIHDIENTLDVFLAEHGAHIRIPQPLPAITCDKPRVAELFRNLITNAVKYNDRPEKEVEIGVLPERASPQGTRHRRVFYVKDNGRGIAPEFHEEVFRIFKRLQGSRNAAQEGTGVGLTFVKKIVERHSGRIWLESQPGQGSVFYFTLEGEHDDTNTA